MEKKVMELRAHHALCLRFFEGKGYSAEFVAAVSALTEKLGKNRDTSVRLTDRPDVLCASCPHNKNGICDSEEKTARYDKSVLSGIGGGEKTWETILAEGKEFLLPRLEEICGDCSWYYICKPAAEKQTK